MVPRSIQTHSGMRWVLSSEYLLECKTYIFYVKSDAEVDEHEECDEQLECDDPGLRVAGVNRGYWAAKSLSTYTSRTSDSRICSDRKAR